ncbi:MAG: site-specific DNA-methyltransferase, partial [Planctomycetes bacterium]|nr:site-specific DNA-methyltransferase [Planctomycetota bacterium]
MRDGLNGCKGQALNRKGGTQSRTLGWRSGCACGGDPVPCAVLDPFAGAGTTGLVSMNLGRRAVLVELNPEYAKLARERIEEAERKR